MKRMGLLSIALLCMAMISLVTCTKEKTSNVVPAPNGVLTSGADVSCQTDAAKLKMGYRYVIFGEVPSPITVELDLAEPMDVGLFSMDCCIPDDIVEVWVDGCLRGESNSLATAPAAHAGQTFWVSLFAGHHVIQYINTVSEPGSSGWYLQEIEMPFTGNFYDGDCDGVFTIIIDGCDTGVPNMVLEGGATMLDLIMACVLEAANHGDFVNEVSHLTNIWKKAGLITGEQKELIMNCAATADLP